MGAWMEDSLTEYLLAEVHGREETLFFAQRRVLNNNGIAVG
jgi:hypothetical protein